MKFSIAYAAKWGHALHVELTFAALTAIKIRWTCR